VRQQIPIRAAPRSGVEEQGDVGHQGAKQPFGSLLLVMDARQSPGRSAGSFSNSDHPGNSGSVVTGP
jgi:hypothetical protein